MKNPLLSSESNEWYTPPDIIARVKMVLHGIDIDPASNEIAQSYIRAKTWYGIKDDGLNKPWIGRLWLNPPYGVKSKDNAGASAWINQAIARYDSGDVSSAILLVRGDSDGIRALVARFPCCEPFARIRFLNEKGEISTKPVPGCRLFYLGRQTPLFKQQFSALGTVYQAL